MYHTTIFWSFILIVVWIKAEYYSSPNRFNNIVQHFGHAYYMVHWRRRLFIIKFKAQNRFKLILRTSCLEVRRSVISQNTRFWAYIVAALKQNLFYSEMQGLTQSYLILQYFVYRQKRVFIFKYMIDLHVKI